ncbi:hypothetical protein HUW46_08152 [Amycolatopsis sp. CA-230715]|nr:hypothetical protein HUW46_08152 [Amycolatopsis sp. CA-230715]
MVHEVVMDEAGGFAPRATMSPTVPKHVDLRDEGDTLRVMLLSAQLHGFVRRRPPAVRLGRGEWLRWRINYRFRTYFGAGLWRYRLDTLNIFHGTECTPELFLGEPDRTIDERAELR